MELSFENHHVVAVVVFMVALLFCKQVLECMHSLLQVWQGCITSACCCNYGREELLRGGLLAALMTFSVCQPIIFVLVQAAGNAFRGRQGFWTVNFVHTSPRAHSDPFISAPRLRNAASLSASDPPGNSEHFAAAVTLPLRPLRRPPRAQNAAQSGKPPRPVWGERGLGVFEDSYSRRALSIRQDQDSHQGYHGG